MCNFAGRLIGRRTMLGGVLGAGALLAAGRLTASADPGAPRTVSARQRFFGVETVDARTGAVAADRVVLAWVGCTTYALAIGGSVFLLDAWVPRLTSTGYVPATPQDLADLAPEAIFIGHGHFDHAGDAGRIAQACGAVVYGTAEHGSTIRAQAPDPGFETVALGDAQSLPGERHDFTVGAVEVTAIRHLHSAPTAPERPGGSAPFFPLPELCALVQHPPTVAGVLQNVPRLNDPEGGSLFYQFRVPGFSLAWHDSTGPLTEKAPRVFDVFASLPPTDLHIGAVQGFNQLTNGLRDPRRYIEAVAPTMFVPSHHDNWLPGVTAGAAAYDPPLLGELARIPATARPELRSLHDPADYLRPELLTFAL
ncbi:MBL fold metallo-hydrolase [Nocardia brasiliensis]|uniref:MBL fold metallo-hydrolase n=1 Tax=Nocardia brasiliensis TaxID=37326 RepID=A0A6G9XSM4_NOCBR|nr:MBL fold metallo-hydrolase [Nocardia brasiliensis]QIS03908.1 MBL fold metallo-hydrolase [Nocardia brasiliensis]